MASALDLNPDPTTWGPQYWADLYGYTTFEAFFEDAEPLLGGFTLLGFSPPTELLARSAWYLPVSPQGGYLAIRLLGKGNSSAEWDKALLVAASAVNQSSLSFQENTVPQLVIPNCFQVSIEAVVGGRSVFNVIGVQNASGTAAGAAAAVKTAWEAVGSPLRQLSSLVAVTNYHAVDIGSINGTIVDLPSTATGGVTASNSLATRGAAALIKWNGGTRNRSSRGRMYFGPIMEANINPDGATLGPASVTSFDGIFLNFRNSLNSSGYPLVVLSRTLSTAFPVTTHATESTIATQRRRIRS